MKGDIIVGTKMLLLLLTFTFLLQTPVSTGSGSTSNVPAFENFPVSDIYKGKPAAPILRTLGDRAFRTRIREGAKEGPNFAGQYTITKWGCGTYCVSMVLIDAKTGTIYHVDPFGILGHYFSGGNGFSGGYYGDAPGKDATQLEYRLDSRLLIVRGCPEDEEDDCATYFYEWTGSEFKLLHRIPVMKPRKD